MPQQTYQSSEAWRTFYPFASNFFCPAEGLHGHYLDEGRGHPVVMVHGNPTWSFYYRKLVAALRSDYRCIVPDHIGCGLSDKPQDYAYTLENHIDNLERLLFEHLHLDRFTLVMHDWGGAIGMGVAGRHPQAVEKLVILNTGAFHMSNHCPWRIRICRVPGFGALAIRGGNAFVRGALRMAVAAPAGLPPAVRSGYLAPYGSWHDRIATLRFVQDIPLAPSHPSWATLSGVEAGLEHFRQTPTAIFWGGRDFCFDQAFLDRWLQLLPQAELHHYPDAGHYVLEDAGDKIIPQIHQFISKPD